MHPGADAPGHTDVNDFFRVEHKNERLGAHGGVHLAGAALHHHAGDPRQFAGGKGHAGQGLGLFFFHLPGNGLNLHCHGADDPDHR